MTQLKLTNLTVDLLQGQAQLHFNKPAQSPTPDKPQFTTILINVPIAVRDGEGEGQLSRRAKEQAKKALEEAIGALSS